MSIEMADKDGNIRNELMYHADIPALFQQGWDAGFQEALRPDTHPDQDRCLETYLQMVGSGMIQIDKPVARLAKFLAITAPDEDVVDAAIDNLRRFARQLSEERLNRQRINAVADMAVKRLADIFGLIQPEPIEHDGKVFSFHPPDEHLREVWVRLSAAIRAIPSATEKPTKHADCQDECQTAAARGPVYRCDHRPCDMLACEEYDKGRDAEVASDLESIAVVCDQYLHTDYGRQLRAAAGYIRKPRTLPPLTDAMYHAVRGMELEFGHGDDSYLGIINDEVLDDIWEAINTALRVQR